MFAFVQCLQWRETSFLRNPRLLVSEDALLARATVGHTAATLELWRWGSNDAPLAPASTYAFPSPASPASPSNMPSNAHAQPAPSQARVSPLTARDGLWSVLASAPEAQMADLLLVSFDRTFVQPEAACFRNQLGPCEHLLRTHIDPPLLAPSPAAPGASGASVFHVVVAPPWLLVLGASLRWCNLDKVSLHGETAERQTPFCFHPHRRNTPDANPLTVRTFCVNPVLSFR